MLSATDGEVEVNGRISALLELGAGFNMEYNGIDNIYLNGTMIGFSEKEIEEKMDDILEFADIGEYVYQPVKTYSSGMFMRLAFAVAINIDPEILIVDEALSVGDVFFQAKCYHKFEDFKKAGKTVLFVSHDLSSISKYCDRVVLLNQGHKLGEGSPKDMIDLYKQVLVGQFATDPGAAQHNPDAQGEGNAQGAETAGCNDKEGAAEAGDKNSSGSDSGNTAGKAESTAAGKASDDGSGDSSDGAGGAQPDTVARNTETLEYGSRKAEITGFGMYDDKGRPNSTVLKGAECKFFMDVAIREDIPAPIFALSIKNVQGVEITGTNTMAEKAFLDPVKAGEKKHITFRQKIDLQGGEYLISLGVTGFEQENFTVYHRNLTVVSDKNTVGYYDMNSIVEVS